MCYSRPEHDNSKVLELDREFNTLCSEIII